LSDLKTESSHHFAEPTSEATTASLLTGVGRSAIAVIAVAGPGAARVIHECFAPATRRQFVAGQIRYGAWHGVKSCESVSPGDSRKKTKEDAASESIVMVPVSDSEFEIHCHGGIAATDRIFRDLQQRGVAIVSWRSGSWKPDEPLLIREAQTVLSECLTTRTAGIAMNQVRGALLQWCQRASTSRASFETTREEAQEILDFGHLEVGLHGRFRVVLAGRPNVGKSSLINAIVGYDRSITLDHPGTTRDVLHADTVIDGWPIQLSDTAGIRDGKGDIEREGIRRANQAVREADLVIWVTTPDQLAPPVLEKPGLESSQKSIQVLNKADLAAEDIGPTDSCKTVATTGQGVPELMAQISKKLVPKVPAAKAPLSINARQRGCLETIVAATDRQSQNSAIARLLSTRLQK
jgi:tRNA modification GTPase